ncbi:hypothetical protein YE3094_33881 [Yersinia enterocolitica (type O:2) str. YE3094/96]|nr:hypothetical protein YE3094_33881 [Yersinia enterocolitica (type O:2) str. YE3094/96]
MVLSFSRVTFFVSILSLMNFISYVIGMYPSFIVECKIQLRPISIIINNVIGSSCLFFLAKTPAILSVNDKNLAQVKLTDS